MAQHVLAIDQGTSSSRALIFDRAFSVVGGAQQEFEQIYPQPGWVEHDPEAIWGSVEAVCRQALSQSGLTASEIAAIGITNQRETTVIWDRKTGECIYNAIVWQDRRTAAFCRDLRGRGLQEIVAAKTGLRLDPYFSATKIAWILENVAGARERAVNGELAFGTVDCFLLWRLSGGARHATDATNASRTLLFNIHDQQWDPELLQIFGIPESLLPIVEDCAAEFGVASCEWLEKDVPVLGIAGDQQAALIGQACLQPGMTKSTYGTGCFVIANTGSDALASQNKLLTTVAMRIDGEVTYGLEGSVFVAGSAIQWLRDELGILESAQQTEAIARRTGVVDDIVVVPAFTGLGAPYWDPDARGAILGLTRGSDHERIVTATLQSIAFQTCDLVQAMSDDGIAPSVIRVDGGMVNNDWFLQFLADVLNISVERPSNVESTVLGSAYLAAYKAGILANAEQIAENWHCEARFDPCMSDERRNELLDHWQTAVNRIATSE